MKKTFFSILVLFTSFSFYANQKDYEYSQDWILKGSKGVGAVGGAVLGGALGAGVGKALWLNSTERAYDPDDPELEQFLNYQREEFSRGAAKVAMVPGMLAGAVSGYKIGGALGFEALKKRYNVPAIVASVSIQYGLLLSTNKSLLMAAYSGDNCKIRDLLNKKMKLIFGSKWKQKISQFLKEYLLSPIAFAANFKKADNRKLDGALRIFSAVSVLYSEKTSFMPSRLEDQMEAMNSMYETFFQ